MLKLILSVVLPLRCVADVVVSGAYYDSSCQKALQITVTPIVNGSNCQAINQYPEMYGCKLEIEVFISKGGDLTFTQTKCVSGASIETFDVSQELGQGQQAVATRYYLGQVCTNTVGIVAEIVNECNWYGFNQYPAGSASRKFSPNSNGSAVFRNVSSNGSSNGSSITSEYSDTHCQSLSRQKGNTITIDYVTCQPYGNIGHSATKYFFVTSSKTSSSQSVALNGNQMFTKLLFLVAVPLILGFF